MNKDVLLKEISEVNGVSGFEKEATRRKENEKNYTYNIYNRWFER